jgi:hypothetical protein
MLHIFFIFSPNILSSGPEHVLGGPAHDTAVMAMLVTISRTSHRPVVPDGSTSGDGHNNEHKGSPSLTKHLQNSTQMYTQNNVICFSTTPV